MISLLTLASLTLSTAGIAAAAPDVFTISAMYTGSDGKRVTLPTWYGDGHMYVGSSVPTGVQTAFNYTANTTRSDLLYIHAAEPLLPNASSALDLPDPTFLALNAGSSSSGSPLEFRHDAIGLSDDWILFFSRYGSLILAQTPSGQLLSSFYLTPSPSASDGGDDDGASIITWGKNAAATSAGTTQQLVSLIAVS
ncbi:hypothetical protein F4810DRAFT_471453 [Camillea tinctor]|nr:hypothetical protein F4810DRAFT_471453 [Camillea tinctor]